jgi:cellulose biosynthesis protein BcsQ
MSIGFDKMARPYLEELEAMLAADLTKDEGFDYNDFDDKLMEIEQGLMEIPDSITRSRALRLLSQVKEEYDVFDADGELEAMFDDEDLEEMNEW